MLRLALLSILAVIFGGFDAEAARDHLWPESSLYDGFFTGTPDTAFRPLYESDVIARMIAEPAFFPAFGVAISESQGHYSVEAIQLQRDHRPPTRCVRKIDQHLGERVISAWRKVLLGTRYSDDSEFGADGETRHFSMIERFPESVFDGARTRSVMEAQLLSGRVWMADPNSLPALLGSLADGLMDLCQRPTPATGLNANAHVLQALDRIEKAR